MNKTPGLKKNTGGGGVMITKIGIEILYQKLILKNTCEMFNLY